MPEPVTRLRLFLDNNVPDSLGRYLQRRGHSVQRQRFWIPADSPDPVVATTAMEADRILVTLDKDFNSQRFQQDRFARLCRISLSGPAHQLTGAIKEHIHLIEAQWEHCVRTRAARMIVHVKPGQIRIRA